ncbi:hypothetical protein RIF23_09385 [Lipingzhangella sp. LS1_29]|uniref:Teneurin NHL domain-containing protein n=1 Tax=Lipingzhangella rawalii TaxID=2055835 RepID=A0ABU2H5C4_9ACTN|nr:hypothetical protein [Lipingzhangella rawalii]
MSAIASAVCIVLLLHQPTPASGTDEPPRGSVVTVAGTGESGYSGDGHDAVDARLNDRLNIDLDSGGTLYIADRDNQRLRVVEPDGTIDTVPGTRGERSPETEDTDVDDWIYGPGNAPIAVATDETDAVYVAARNDLRVIDPDGEFTTVVDGSGDDSGADFRGDGDGGDGGPAIEAALYRALDVAVGDAGTLYIADTSNDRIRVVDTDGEIDTLAGGGGDPLTEATEAAEAHLPRPQSVALDSTGAVYVTVENRAAVFRVAPDGSLQVVAGTGDPGYAGDGGPATEAQL